jgi:hypothetical protein
MFMMRFSHKWRPAGDSPQHNKKLWTPGEPWLSPLGLSPSQLRDQNT